MAEPWRVGRRVPIHLYAGDEAIGTMLSAEHAAHAVYAVNAQADREARLVRDLAEARARIGEAEALAREAIRVAGAIAAGEPRPADLRVTLQVRGELETNEGLATETRIARQGDEVRIVVGPAGALHAYFTDEDQP